MKTQENVSIFWDNGVVIDSGGTAICFDLQQAVTRYQNVFISHAHGDHAIGFEAKNTIKYATSITAEIFEAKSGKRPTKFNALDYGAKLKVGDLEVTTYNAGHILGAAQFKVETGEKSIVYTGDLNCVDTFTTTEAEKVPCDILIIESTYGRPELIFPSRDVTYRRIIEWVIEKIKKGKIPLFHVYSVGKAQEIIKLLNEFTDLPIIAHPKISKISKVYEKYGIRLNLLNENESENLKREKFIVIDQYNTSNFMNVENKISAVATGWAVMFRGREGAFPLSCHADFRQLINYIDTIRPKRVYTCFGYSEDLAKSIEKRLNVKAKPLMPMCRETKLSDFNF
jgi:Cft2 family RNA processing exonuclease